jgi:F-type H+-transporting ATPase subunit a
VSKLLSRKVLVPTLILIVVLVVLNLVFQIPGVVLPEISIAAETVFEFDLFGFWPNGITNTLLSSWLTTIVLVVSAWALTRKMRKDFEGSLTPGRGQGSLEMVIEGFYNLVEGASGAKWARRFFPIVMTIFLFVIVSNWIGLTPLFGGWGALHHGEHGQSVIWLNESHTVGLWEEAEDSHAEAEQNSHEGEVDRYALAPMFRAATTDLNVTFALAIVSVLLTQYFGLKALGIGYLGKFIAVGGIVRAFTKKGLGCVGRIAALGMGIIDVFIGIVELISEIGKIISFSFRLFGNIFAGEVLLGVMAFLVPYLVSLPFYGLEIFVGFVQAMVFMMLTVAFFIVATTGHGEGH